MTAFHGFVPIRTSDADLTRVQQAIGAALDELAAQLGALAEVAFPTHAALRLQVGDPNGAHGPAVALVAGNKQALDGGEGAWAWDPASTASDDDSTTLQAAAASTGRWRKLRNPEARGGDVASATLLVLTGTYSHVTGATGVSFIDVGAWGDAARVELLVVAGLTFAHNAGAVPAGAYSLQLLSGAATAKAANSVIAFRKDAALSRWVQVA